MSGLWRNNPETPEGKYLVMRRDGTIPEWENMVFGACDPATPAALFAYADRAEDLGMDSEYIDDVRAMAGRWESGIQQGTAKRGDPDAPRHRKDDPETIRKMIRGHST